MEPQQESSNGDGSCGKAGFVSRQSSTRWSPTSEQIRILKDLYYNYGIRSPSAEQIQNISTRLRQYGKIEAKNVFYWFQNHKARDRLKRTFTSDHAANITSTGVSFASSSAAGIVTADQKGSYGYGSLTMEKSFRDCLISDGGRNGTASNNYDLGWVEMDPYSSTYTTFFDKTTPTEEVQESDGAPEIETLPLFPMQAEHIHGYYNLNKSASFYDEEGFKNTSSASLELCLNSYTSTSPDSTLNIKP